MKNPNKVSSGGKLQRWQLGVGILSVVGLTTLAVVVSTSTPTNDSFSKFTTGTQITSQNASSNWTGGSDNPYRAKLSSLYVGRLDTLTTAILRKGTSMSDTQFKTYLTNLSTGISGLGSRSQYANDTEVQNILGFLVYEVNATVSALSSNSNAASVMGEVAGLINGSGSSGGQSNQVGGVAPARKLTLDDFEAKCETMEPNPKYTTKYGNTTVYPANRYIYSNKENCPERLEVSGNEAGSKGVVIKKIVVVPKNTANFKLTPQKDTDGYWQNATLEQWESIYSLIESIISQPADLDKTHSNLNGESELVVRIPNTGYDKAWLFRGITLAFTCDNAECALQSISDNSNYDKTLVGKAKYFIPRDLPLHIVGGDYQGTSYRGYWSVAAFGKKPEYSVYKTSGELAGNYWQTETIFPSVHDSSGYNSVIGANVKTQAKAIASGISFSNQGLGCVSGYNCGGAGIMDIFYGTTGARRFDGFVPIQAGYLYQDAGVTPDILNVSPGRHADALKTAFMNPINAPKDPEGVGGALNHDWTVSTRLYWSEVYNKEGANYGDKNAFVLPKIKQAISDIQAMRALGSTATKTPENLKTQDNSPELAAVDGQCPATFNSYEATPKCTTGISTPVTVNGSTYTWGCKGVYGGKDTATNACSAKIVPVEYTWINTEWSTCMPSGYDANGKLQGFQSRYPQCAIKSPDAEYGGVIGQANDSLCPPLADATKGERICSLN